MLNVPFERIVTVELSITYLYFGMIFYLSNRENVIYFVYGLWLLGPRINAFEHIYIQCNFVNLSRIISDKDVV